MYISENCLTGTIDGGEKIIEPGSKTICQAIATVITHGADGQVEREEQVITKLDSCGSVSIAHSDYLAGTGSIGESIRATEHQVTGDRW